MNKFLLLLPFLLLKSYNSSAQCNMVEIPFEERVSSSTHIVEGEVIDKYSYWDSNHHLIYTSNTLKVYKLFKGNIDSLTVEIITVGGEVGDEMLTATPSLQINVGDKGIFLGSKTSAELPGNSSKSNLLRLDLAGDIQGFIRYDHYLQTAQGGFTQYTGLSSVYDSIYAMLNTNYKEIEVLPQPRLPMQLNATPVVSSFYPDSISAGTGSVLTITGSNFGNVKGNVTFKNADYGVNQTNPFPHQFISWNDTQIKVMVPHKAGTGFFQVTNSINETSNSNKKLYVSFAQTNVENNTRAYQPRHILKDTNTGGYVWRINTNMTGDTAVVNRITESVQQWRCASLINWRIGNPTNFGVITDDKVEIMTWGELNGYLGICYTFWKSCTDSNNQKLYWVSSTDIKFDSTYNWSFGDTIPSYSYYDFKTVVLHELGHAHQMGHVLNYDNPMYTPRPSGSKFDLNAQNTAGGQHIISQGIQQHNCSAAPDGIVKLNSNKCSLSFPYPKFNVSKNIWCLGDSVSFVDDSKGEITNWNWDFGLGATPANDTGKSPRKCFYSTTGAKTIRLITTGPLGSDTITKNAFIVVTKTPDKPIITGPKTVCINSSTDYEVGYNDYENYTWTITGGGAFSGAITGNKITIDWGNTTGGPYTLSAFAHNTCGKSNTAFYTINVIETPAKPTGLDIDATCLGINTIGVTPVTFAETYLWNIDNGDPIIGSDSSDSITVNWTKANTQVTITVHAKNICGTSQDSLKKVVALLGKPRAPVGIDGSGLICIGPKVYYATTDNHITNYKWEISGGGSFITADTVNPVSVYWSASDGPYTLFVKQMNMCDTSVTTEVEVNVAPNPIADFSFSVNNETVTFTNNSSGGNTYSWNFGDGAGFSNDENPTYKYSWPSIGTYTVILTVNNDCASDNVIKDVNITTTGINFVSSTIKINIYPNPLKDKALITLKGDLSDEYTFELYDVNGRIVKTIAITEKETTLDASELSAGVYMYKIREGDTLLKDGKLIIE